jgi:2-methylcitrate synthase
MLDGSDIHASPGPSARCQPQRRNEFSFETRSRDSPDAEADIRRIDNKMIIGFGHPVYTIADPRNNDGEPARGLSQEAGSLKMFSIADGSSRS